MNNRSLFGLLLIFVFLLSVNSAYSQIDITDNNWHFIDGAQIQEKDGQQVVYFTRGKMTYKGQALQDGIVEFDMYTPGDRAFVYLYFREASSQESEVVYLRTHKSNAPDTLQYAPVYQGRSAWQLYHGDKGTASASLAANIWISVKVEFQGSNLRVWVGDQTEPVMHKARLTRKPIAGGITLRGNIPPASAAAYSTYVRNIKITPLPNKQVENKPSVALPSERTHITQINLSPLFAANKQAILELPSSITDKDWSIVEAESDGVFELLKWRKIPKGMRSWAAAGKFIIHSNREQICPLYLGYSDTITLHLNNKEVAFADASYRYNQNRQEGVLHDQQLQVFLPLNAGENTVTAIVADSFGGWGLQASLGNCEGVSLGQFK